jgi:MoaA/NifB/PqqE/SkfB family radical SAM enzyme
MLKSTNLILRGLGQHVRGRPVILAHTINAECNLKCPFCPFWRRKGEEMSKEEIFEFLRKCRDFGITVYNVWSTEPLLREDLGECLRFAKSLGMVTFVITNGTLLKKKLEELRYCDYLAVSIDGMKSYQELRGGNLDEVLEGIVMAKNAGIRISINCVLNGMNLDEVDELVRLAENLGVGILFEPVHEYGSIPDTVWEEIGIRNQDKYVKTVDRIIEMKRHGKPILNSFAYLRIIRNLKPEFRCRVNEVILHLGLNGKIESCSGVIGDFRDDLDELWSSWRREAKSLAEDCEGCLFSGYVETSLLFNFNLRVMWNYLRWL